MHTSKTVFIQ